MLKLQKQRVHNINFVTPTHYLPQILAALWLAIPQGFSLPIVWNTSGYEKIDALQLLDGVVSIYLPDMKYSDDVPAPEISSAPGYCRINRAAVSEMLRQVGHLQVDDNGIAVRGLIIRHLVLPDGKPDSGNHTLDCRKPGEGNPYRPDESVLPCTQGVRNGRMNRPVNHQEYDAAVAALAEAGLENGWVQDLDEERGAV